MSLPGNLFYASRVGWHKALRHQWMRKARIAKEQERLDSMRLCVRYAREHSQEIVYYLKQVRKAS